MMICLGLNIPTIFAESHVNKNGEASFKDSDAQQTMTLTNDYADRPQLEKLKHSPIILPFKKLLIFISKKWLAKAWEEIMKVMLKTMKI